MKPTAPADQVPVLTVTLNPALDLSTTTASVRPDLKLRCDAPLIHPGGGGVNVSRAIRLMGGTSCAFVALGGLTGQRVARLMQAEGIALAVQDLPGETRESFTATDRATGQQYRYVLPGPEWSPAMVDEALATIAARVEAGGYVVLSGSNPPGVPPGFGRDLAQAVAQAGGRLIVDTSGEALRRITQPGGPRIEVLRIDGPEAEALAGRPLPHQRDTLQFARELLGRGLARAVVIARGADGNLLASADGCWHAEAKRVPILSKIGAGDSYVAGLTLALARGWPDPLALALGAAAATATIQTPATELCPPADVEALFDPSSVTRIDC